MPAASDQLYFAYGSNLWLQQMAVRCPNSRYVGRAILPEYRWQINQRGFANVVPASGYTVHGLVYRVRGRDQTRLDRSEGINSGAYSKAYKGVVLYPALTDLALPTWQLVEATGGPAGAVDEARRRRPRRATLERKPHFESHVLVYISGTFTRWGYPRDEYTNRMNSGIRDAMALSVPAGYFENVVRGSIPRGDHVRVRSREERRAATPGAIGGRSPRAVSEGPRNRRLREDQSPGRERDPCENRWGAREIVNVIHPDSWGLDFRRNSRN